MRPRDLEILFSRVLVQLLSLLANGVQRCVVSLYESPRPDVVFKAPIAVFLLVDRHISAARFM